MHIGIDPGIKGAVAGVNDNGKLVFAWDMPTRVERGKRSVDTAKLADMLSSLSKYYLQSVMVEKPFYKPGLGKYDAHGKYNLPPRESMTAKVNSGVVYGMCMMMSRETKLIEPAIWKRSVGIPTGSDKKVSIAMAKSLFGAETEKALAKDGRAEAAMIAYYSMRCHKLERTHKNEGALTL